MKHLEELAWRDDVAELIARASVRLRSTPYVFHVIYAPPTFLLVACSTCMFRGCVLGT